MNYCQFIDYIYNSVKRDVDKDDFPHEREMGKGGGTSQ